MSRSEKMSEVFGKIKFEPRFTQKTLRGKCLRSQATLRTKPRGAVARGQPPGPAVHPGKRAWAPQRSSQPVTRPYLVVSFEHKRQVGISTLETRARG